MFHGHLDYFRQPPLGGRPNTKPGDHGTPNSQNHWFILVYHVWEPAWIKVHWNSIWLRARSHMTSNYTWGSVNILHNFGGASGRPSGTFFWALTIEWSRFLAHVWSGPNAANLQSWWSMWPQTSVSGLRFRRWRSPAPTIWEKIGPHFGGHRDIDTSWLILYHQH
jgi:hypothetical protein